MANAGWTNEARAVSITVRQGKTADFGECNAQGSANTGGVT
jgi:hypothetical protein